MSKSKSNKKVKQSICDVLVSENEHVEHAWFSDECPLQCIGKRNGKIEYLKLHIVEHIPNWLRIESIKKYKRTVSIKGSEM